MKIFITFNPHLENYSKRKLLENFKYSLKKYYRKELGRRYYKHIDNQYNPLYRESNRNFCVWQSPPNVLVWRIGRNRYDSLKSGWDKN